MNETFERLSAIPGLDVRRGVPLSAYTRFGIGGPADLFIETRDASLLADAWRVCRATGIETVVIGGGTNLIVADDGLRGAVIRYTADAIRIDRASVEVDAGAVLQDLVDRTIAAGLRGLETMTGIPGSVGAAVYGNAGAYGRSIAESVLEVRFLDGDGAIRTTGNAPCEFRYRESVFKRYKDRTILSATLALQPGDAPALKDTADRIRAIRDKKYPPTMRCAGSIFKNYLFADLPPAAAAEVPPAAVIEGKVPSAWFLERVGAKGMRVGDIQVADYHANLIYNDGQGTARDLSAVIQELKRRVEERWRMPLEEEVQYVGFFEKTGN